MSRSTIPIAVMKSERRIHRSNGEIEAREKSEIVEVSPADIVPPSYLTSTQKKHFLKLAGQLSKLKIMGETDCETLARYVIAEDAYEGAVRDMRKASKDKPDKQTCEAEGKNYLEELETYFKMYDAIVRRQDRMCDQASTLARDLGLTISSRCKLVVPKSEEPKVNKFAVLQSAANA